MSIPELAESLPELDVVPSRSLGIWAVLGSEPIIFIVCFLAWTITNMDQAIFGYAVPGILAEFGVPLKTVGVILTVSFLTAAVLVVAAGVAGDRLGRSLTMALLLATSALMVGLQGLAGGIVMLAALRALGFGFSGGLAPITMALAMESAYPKIRGVAMGLLQCGTPLGWLLASLFAAPLLQHYGWRAACCAAFAVIPLGLAIYYSLRGRTSPPPEKSIVRVDSGPQAPGLRMLFLPPYRRSSLAIMAIFFLFGGAYAGSAYFFPTFFTQTRGYTAAQAASLVGLSNGIAVFGYMGAALIGEFLITRRNVFVLWCIGGAVALLALMWFSAGHTEDLIWYGLTASLFFGSQAVVAVLISEAYPAAVRATALALCASAPMYIGFAVFPLIVPAIVSALGWQLGLSIAIAPPLLAAGLAALFLPNNKSGMVLS